MLLLFGFDVTMFVLKKVYLNFALITKVQKHILVKDRQIQNRPQLLKILSE